MTYRSIKEALACSLKEITGGGGGRWFIQGVVYTGGHRGGVVNQEHVVIKIRTMRYMDRGSLPMNRVPIGISIDPRGLDA